MHCPSCDSTNAPDARFCISCGAAMGRVCPSCAHVNPAAGRFCTQCGGALGASPAPRAARPSPDGELKQITVLFADVSGSTELIESLDPEAAARRLAPALDAMQEAVRRFEGSVVKVQGDGIMAVFGTPKPQEDHAVRACCAGLALQAAIRALPGEPIPVRVGINSGDVLARTVATSFSTDFDATGLTVHIANRLESFAPQGGVVISPSTLRGARQFVSVVAVSRQPIRGLSTPIEVFQLTGLRRGPTSRRFSAAEDRSDFIGRELELSLLGRALERAGEGNGCAVGLVAEAGVGKSRLCFEFAEKCRAGGIRVLEGCALAHGRATPFEPIIDLLKMLFEITPDDSPAQGRDKIAALLARLDDSFATDLPLLFDFLGIADPAASREKLDAGARRERLDTMFRRLVHSAGRAAPTVLLLEDLHWMDSGSESLIELLAGSLAGTRILLLVNFRPGYVAPWMGSDRYEQIPLLPLRQSAADEFATRLLGDHPSVKPLLPLIADRSRGNPFFIEELVRKFAESGNLEGEPGAYRLIQPPDIRLIPDNVQAIVSARVDSQPELERTLLQTAAVVGREFGVALLGRVASLASPIVDGALRRLTAAGLVYEADVPAAAGFAFKHPMVQEVVYRSLVSERRRALHTAVAAELEKTLPDPNGAQAGFLAYHFEEAGNVLQAASYNMKAAMWHGTRDPAQALAAWRRVRRQLLSVPLEGPARYPLLMASGQIVNMAWREGLTAADVEPYYIEALGIASELGDMRGIVLVTGAYGRALASTGSADDYVTKVGEALAMLDAGKHASQLVVLNAVRCHALWLAGDLRSALAANDQVLASLDKVDPFDEQTLGFRIDVWTKGLRSKVLAMMGRFDEARAIALEMIGAEEAVVDTMHRLLAHGTMTDIAWGLGDAALAGHHGAAALALAEKSGNPYLIVYGRAFRALAHAIGGELSEATTLLNETLSFARLRHAGLENEARMLCDLAWVQQRAGLKEHARDTAEEAARVAQRRGAKLWLAYAERLRAGPDAASFRKLVADTDAQLLVRLPA